MRIVHAGQTWTKSEEILGANRTFCGSTCHEEADSYIPTKEAVSKTWIPRGHKETVADPAVPLTPFASRLASGSRAHKEIPWPSGTVHLKENTFGNRFCKVHWSHLEAVRVWVQIIMSCGVAQTLASWCLGFGRKTDKTSQLVGT